MGILNNAQKREFQEKEKWLYKEVAAAQDVSVAVTSPPVNL